MPCQFVLARDGTVVLEQWAGRVSLEDLVGHKTSLAKNLSLKAGASVLSDCTRASFKFSPDAITKLSEMENDPDSDTRIKRYAFLVSESDYDKAQQFANAVEKYGKVVIVFNSLDVASTWLGMDMSEVVALLQSMESVAD